MEKTIRVSGTGKISVSPDVVELTIRLSTLDKKYEKAVAGTGRKAEALAAAAAEAGFAPGDLKTTLFRVEVENENRQDADGVWRNHFVGYDCAHAVKLSFPLDMERLARLIDAICGCLSEPDLNVAFTVADRDRVADELLRDAARNAARKAAVLAEAAGVTLGELVSVDYSWNELRVFSDTDLCLNEPMMKASRAVADMVPEDVDLSDSAVFVWRIGEAPADGRRAVTL